MLNKIVNEIIRVDCSKAGVVNGLMGEYLACIDNKPYLIAIIKDEYILGGNMVYYSYSVCDLSEIENIRVIPQGTKEYFEFMTKLPDIDTRRINFHSVDRYVENRFMRTLCEILDELGKGSEFTEELKCRYRDAFSSVVDLKEGYPKEIFSKLLELV